ARSFPEIPDTPNWNNVAPRFGAVYNLTGDAKTALKGSVNKYNRNFTTDFTNRYNPLVLQSDTRNWADCDYLPGTSTCSSLVLPTNRDNIAQDNEIGPANIVPFGVTPARRADPDLKRTYNWDSSISVQHQLVPRVAVVGDWYYSKYGNLQ